MKSPQDNYKKHMRNDLALRIVITVLWISLILLITISLISCSTDSVIKPETVEVKPCEADCGMINYTHWFQDRKEITIMFVNECGETITETISIPQDKLGNDDGYAYFIDTYKLKDIYCKKRNELIYKVITVNNK